MRAAQPKPAASGFSHMVDLAAGENDSQNWRLTDGL
jgi:hypothetical protein